MDLLKVQTRIEELVKKFLGSSLFGAIKIQDTCNSIGAMLIADFVGIFPSIVMCFF